MAKSRVLVLLGLILVSTGCTTVVHKITDKPFEPDPMETSLGTDIDDFQIEMLVGVNIKKAHPQLENAHININSYNGVILLTGEVASDSLRKLAGDTARHYRGVRLVHNQLQIQGTASMLSRANDTWLSTKVRSKLLARNDIDSGKIKVVTESGVIYLMGIVTPVMAEKAVSIARTTGGARRVVKVFEYVEPR